MQSAEGKGTRDEVQRIPGTSVQASSLRTVTWDVLNSSAMGHDITWEALPTREAH